MRFISLIFVSLVLTLSAGANIDFPNEGRDLRSNQPDKMYLREAPLRGQESQQEETLVNKEAVKRGFWHCKLFSYNPFYKGCCKGVVYTKKTHACCEDKVIYKMHCGGKAFNPCKEGCCRGEDQSRVYYKFIKKCCHGKVEFKSIFKKKGCN